MGLAATIGGADRVFAATLTVTTTNDNGDGSLRQAIQTAGPGDAIEFAVSGAIALTNGQLFVTNNLSIVSPGATNLAVSGNASSRVFEISSKASVSISGLTIKNGRTVGAAGASSSIGPGGDGSPARGGGVLNAGVLSLAHCIITDNSAAGGAGGSGGSVSGNGGSAAGGAICSLAGSVVISNCSLVGRVALGSFGKEGVTGVSWPSSGGSGFGGAIYVLTGNLAIASCVVSSNSVAGGRGGSGYGQSTFAGRV